MLKTYLMPCSPSSQHLLAPLARPVYPEPSHVLRAIGLTAEHADASVRFSIGRQTKETDIEKAIKIISDVLARLDQSPRANYA